MDVCSQLTDAKLSAIANSRQSAADVINWTQRRLQWVRDTCSDVTVTSCGTCWRRYGDVVTTLVTWRHVVTETTETTQQQYDVWMMIDRYKQQLMMTEMRCK